MLNTGLKALAPLGLAAVLALGLSACSGETAPEPPPAGETAEANPCHDLIQGRDVVDGTLQPAVATPAPANPSELHTSDDVRETQFSDTQYVVGWTDLKSAQWDVDALEDVKIVTFEGTVNEDCEIHVMEGGRDTEADPSRIVYTYVGSGIPTNTDAGYLSFKNPLHPDERVVLKLWNLSGGVPSNNEFNLIEDMGDVDLY